MSGLGENVLPIRHFALKDEIVFRVVPDSSNVLNLVSHHDRGKYAIRHLGTLLAFWLVRLGIVRNQQLAALFRENRHVRN